MHVEDGDVAGWTGNALDQFNGIFACRTARTEDFNLTCSCHGDFLLKAYGKTEHKPDVILCYASTNVLIDAYSGHFGSFFRRFSIPNVQNGQNMP
jgi:hypothetical protein